MQIKLRNRLEVLMKDNGVSTFEEMAERLTNNQNWEITRSALSRKFRNPNPPLTLEMITAICNELQCLPNDLFEIESILHDLHQGELSVTQYFNSLTRCWQQLDLFEVHEWTCPADSILYK